MTSLRVYATARLLNKQLEKVKVEELKNLFNHLTPESQEKIKRMVEEPTNVKTIKGSFTNTMGRCVSYTYATNIFICNN